MHLSHDIVPHIGLLKGSQKAVERFGSGSVWTCFETSMSTSSMNWDEVLHKITLRLMTSCSAGAIKSAATTAAQWHCLHN
mmetsp:Transcript_8297/g.8135  ORF Transcript_8297/g.8135 Transcript_8297/m.8135 type:complete len:80 (+) Transcript_8297:1032-1271(+)